MKSAGLSVKSCLSYFAGGKCDKLLHCCFLYSFTTAFIYSEILLHKSHLSHSRLVYTLVKCNENANSSRLVNVETIGIVTKQNTEENICMLQNAFLHLNLNLFLLFVLLDSLKVNGRYKSCVFPAPKSASFLSDLSDFLFID